MAVLYVFLLLFYDAKFYVGEKYPKTFLKIERLKACIFKSFWVLLLAIIGLFGFLLISAFLNFQMEEEIIGIVTFWISFLFTGTWFYYVTMAFYFPRREEFLKLQARVRLFLFLDSLSSKDQRVISKNVPLFREGMQIVNKFFKDYFGFVFKEPNKFYNYIKLMMYSYDETITIEIENGLKVVINELKNKKSDPLKILNGFKSMIAEPTTDRRTLVNEVGGEPSFKKWFLADLRVIVTIIELVSGLVVVIGFLMGR
jgi:hypothetical protein